MNEFSIEAKRADDAASDRPAPHRATGGPHDVGVEGLSAADYCQLAEECFHLAAATKDPAAAEKLIETGHDYLRHAAGWLADQLRT
jgi:hypothetical protein